jgi:hypothetical protein
LVLRSQVAPGVWRGLQFPTQLRLHIEIWTLK